MAGEIQEPIRLNFQADLLHSGSISFGRFESESLSWERRSIFSHNRYLEEVERYSKPGSVTEKKAYFEAQFRRKALLKQSSSESHEGELQDSGNCNESPCSSNPSEYNTETQIKHHEKGYVEDTVSQDCESQNRESIPVVLDNVKIDEIHESEIENVVGNTEEEIVVNVVSEVNDSSIIGQTLEKDDNSNITESRKMFSSKVKPALEKKVTRAKSSMRTQVNVDRFQKHVSNETQKGSMKPRTSENKSLLLKKTEKKSAISSSPLHSRVKTSKSEVLKSEKEVKPRSSLLKKPLPTVNRQKQISSSEGFNFKTDKRAENRKEFYTKITDKMHAKEAEINQVEAKTQKKQDVEVKQFRKSLNFKATPMPSFYNEATRGLNQHKVTPSQPRPHSQSVAKSVNKSTVSSDKRPSSSTSLTNKIRVSESVAKSRVDEKKEKEKKNDTSLMKQKKPELRGYKSGRVVVGVVS